MKPRLFLLVLAGSFGLLGVPVNTQAHPVTFKDGVAAFSTYRPSLTTTEVNYSITPTSALAATHTFFKHEDGSDLHYVVPRLNFLAKRWNEKNSQANIYASGGLGVGLLEGGGESLAGSIALQADWESRRYYTELQSLAYQGEGNQDFHHHRFRFGIAPYLADFDELQTFLIAQTSYTPDKDGDVNAGPVARFFFHRYLGEIGWDFANDGIFATLMVHY